MMRIVLVAAATILGATLRYIVGDWPSFWMVAGLLVVGGALWLLADALVVARPVLACWLYQGSWLAVFAMVAGSAWFATFAGLQLPHVLTSVPPGEVATLSGVILGALSSLVAAAWLDDAKKDGGPFWPEARHSAALRCRYRGDPRMDESATPRTLEMDKLYHAVHSAPDRVNGIDGWSFADRILRARVVATFGP